jgi:hypothetical protein
MLLSLLALLFATRAEPASIYVGPQARDGFVDIDQGVRDSIKDIQQALRKDRAFRVVAHESEAGLKVYVLTRDIAATGSSTVAGVVVQGTGTVTSTPDKVYRLNARLRAGAYERVFVGESEPWTYGTWKRCARFLVRDLAAWVAANRERVLTKEP